jgi:mersacidin/lichenicidin family type 2 lantibiotic
MSTKNIIRAWKDPVYRSSLSDAERAALPAHPAGAIELSDAELAYVAGGKPRLTLDICTKATDYCSMRQPAC